MKMQRITYLSLGSNQGNSLQFLQLALNKIALKVGRISRVSSVYQTAAWGFEGADFLNICCEVHTNLNPEKLLETILKIESNLGRERSNKDGYEERSIDIDVLLFEDEIIFYRDLIVPHPRMLERKFVLAPLAEIAANLRHPIAKTSILNCLQHCADTSSIEKSDQLLNRPISLVEKYNYIAIEGNIGAGKTTLAQMMGDEFNAKLVLERFADNPFLPKFYEDMERYAFPLEMSFLADRYQQLTDDLAQFDLFKSFIISDYYIFKSLIFAQISLAPEEFKLYRKMFDIMYKEITKPDLYLYLYQNTDRLLQNIKMRGRSYEQNIEADYLQKIQQGYSNFMKSEEGLNSLIIDVSDFDFVQNPEDYDRVIAKINAAID